jgi:hypothetical protein
MGAIRAAEMRGLGMLGFGQVYCKYVEALEAGSDFHDDEVAQTHEACPPYRSLSEPMVHVRHALAEWVREGRLGEAVASLVVEELKAMWYGDRTLASMLQAILARDWGANEWLKREVENFDRYRLKNRDVDGFLQLRPWLAAPAPNQDDAQSVLHLGRNLCETPAP